MWRAVLGVRHAVRAARPIVTVALCGGGNGTHVAAAVLARKGANVQIFTRRPQIFGTSIALDLPDGSTVSTPLGKVSSDASEVIPDADIVMIFSPVNAYEAILYDVAPHVKQNAFVGAMFGQAHIDCMVHSQIPAHKQVTAFCCKYIPWQAKIIAQGRHGHLVGAKKDLLVAARPAKEGGADRWEELAAEFRRLFDMEVNRVPFIATAMPTSNQILHPAAYMSVFPDWDGKSTFVDDGSFGPGSLYTRMGKTNAEILQGLNDELLAIKDAMCVKYPDLDMSCVKPIVQRVREQYGEGADYSTLQTTFNSSPWYVKSKFAMKKLGDWVMPDLDHRHFRDDIPFGLICLRSLADEVGVAAPNMDEAIRWHQRVMGKVFLSDDGTLTGKDMVTTGVLARYGIKLEDYIHGRFNFINSMPRKPKASKPLVLFDLDGCLWDMTAETQSEWFNDEAALRAKVFPDVDKVLAWLVEEGYELGFVSRGWYPYLTYRSLDQLGWLGLFSYGEVFASGSQRPMNVNIPADKQLHFEKVRSSSGRDWSEMLFFDNENRWVEQAASLGITGVHTGTTGLSWDHIKQGLKLWEEQQKQPEQS